MSLVSSSVMDRQRGRRKRILATAIVLALLALFFYAASYLADYIHMTAH
ncbi:MAG: hypothetical protein WCB49_00210 [Gammaproteobacteria bacterium]